MSGYSGVSCAENGLIEANETLQKLFSVVAVCSCLVFMEGNSASKNNIDMYYILSSCLHNITSVEEFDGRVKKSLKGKTSIF